MMNILKITKTPARVVVNHIPKLPVFANMSNLYNPDLRHGLEFDCNSQALLD